MFLQSAGTDFKTAHDLVAAVAEIVRPAHGEQSAGHAGKVGLHHSGREQGKAAGRRAHDPERLAERVARAGYEGHDSMLIALAVLATIASPGRALDVDWVGSVAARIDDPDILLETVGVLFAFNTINRIADARRVRLEYRFLRELRPIRGWVERRLVSLASMAYDLSFKYKPRHSPEKLQDRLETVFERLGAPAVPDVFHWLGRSPAVLEGVLEMVEANVLNTGVHAGLWREAVAIGVASRAMPGSDLRGAFEQWLPRDALTDSKSLRTWAAPPGVACGSDLVSACRRYSWQVANAAWTITDEQVAGLAALGLSDAERLDLTLATAAFTALAITEPIGAAIAPESIAATTLPIDNSREVEVQLT